MVPALAERIGIMRKTQYQPSKDCNLLTLPQAVATFNLSSATVRRLAQDCGAVLKIGRSVRIKKDALSEYINTFEG